MLRSLLPAFLLLAQAAMPLHAAPPELKVAIVGDSTVCDYPPEGVLRGWGQFIQEALHDVKVVNLAASGRSTKTFRSEGRWAKALAEKPAVILIQFGHNDSHPAERPEATDAATTYKEFLRQYVDEARAAGARPLLVTPMHRRLFPEGKLSTELLPYATAMREVAAEKKAPLIDLYTSSEKYFTELGEARAPETANNPTDRTHFNGKGARAMAELVLQELPAADPALAERKK